MGGGEVVSVGKNETFQGSGSQVSKRSKVSDLSFKTETWNFWVRYLTKQTKQGAETET
jgi:hypothetical protein